MNIQQNQREEEQEFFLLNTEWSGWLVIIGGITFLTIVILLTGYING